MLYKPFRSGCGHKILGCEGQTSDKDSIGQVSYFNIYNNKKQGPLFNRKTIFFTEMFIILPDRSDASFDGNAPGFTDDSSMPEEDDWGQESGVENLSDLSRLNITSDSRVLEESIAEEPEQVG